jgi:hypothetical protein
MPRALQEDYQELLLFIDGYSIGGAYDNNGLNNIIKPIHKAYYAILVLLAELNHQQIQPVTTCQKQKEDEQIILFWRHLSEAVSELGTAFFLILNGCYKSCDLVMRSSIENFIKALGCLDVVGINQIKNVYEVFEKAGSTAFFSAGIGKKVYHGLSELYGTLSNTVHTGTEQNMQQISALGDFPAIDLDKAVKAKQRYLIIVKLYVSSLSVMFKSSYHKMHHQNRDIVQLSLSADAIKMLAL